MKKLFTTLLFFAIIFVISTFAQITTEGLVAYYQFNGYENDESGNGNNGNVKAASLTADRFDSSGSAYIFNGYSDYIKVNQSNSLN